MKRYYVSFYNYWDALSTRYTCVVFAKSAGEAQHYLTEKAGFGTAIVIRKLKELK